jgi:hypothetical protein
MLPIDFVFCGLRVMGTGGARSGAGRPGNKAKAGQLLGLDVRALAREGYINRDCSFGWRWTRGDEPAGSISIDVEARTELILRFAVARDGQSMPMKQHVSVVYTACHFGQSRPWLLCPCCRQRVAKLYLRWQRFACRVCQRVAYSSQSKDATGRAWTRLHQLEARLVGGNWRPKGMWHRTYGKLITELLVYQKFCGAALADDCLRLQADLGRIGANLGQMRRNTP